MERECSRLHFKNQEIYSYKITRLMAFKHSLESGEIDNCADLLSKPEVKFAHHNPGYLI